MAAYLAMEAKLFSILSRERIEEVFGWIKTMGTPRKVRHRGTLRVGWVFTLAIAVYNPCAHEYYRSDSVMIGMDEDKV
jgi:phosphatidylserine decarboxylase